MRLPGLIQAFVDRLRAMNRRPKTIAAYALWIQRFFAFAAARGVTDPGAVSIGDLHAYQTYLSDHVNLKGRVNAIKVQNNHLLAVSLFLRYLCNEGVMARNPALSIRYAKLPDRLPRDLLSVAHVRGLLAAPDTRTTLGCRDRTIMETLYSTGIRRQELLNLTVDDIDFEGGLIMVRQGKGGKDRVVPLGRIAAKYLKAYIRDMRPLLERVAAAHSGLPSPMLFVSTRGKSLSKTALANLIERHRRVANLQHVVTPHVFRHACATHMIRNRANIRHVQEILGHANLNTTQQYLHLTITDLKDAHREFHPRERDARNATPDDAGTVPVELNQGSDI